MKERDEFYIGWKEDIPSKHRSFLKKILLPVFIAIPCLVILVVLLQKPFNHHQFEFGNIKTISGTYYDSPFPMLVADRGTLPDSLSHDLLLVGYGKFGAAGIMKTIQEAQGNLHGKQITLAGTLIYGDGKTLLELTEEEGSILNVTEKKNSSIPPQTLSKEMALSGEIIDPKCYFGVMKPGEGKVHKSCAIRCISGGIPPVLKHPTQNPDQPFEYYLILDEQGKAMNEELLPFVAESVKLSGKVMTFQSWNILYTDLASIENL